MDSATVTMFVTDSIAVVVASVAVVVVVSVVVLLSPVTCLHCAVPGDPGPGSS